MKDRLNKVEIEQKTGRIDQACARYGIGRNAMRKLAEESGAVVRFGKSYLINFTKVDAYMDSMCGQ